MSRTIATCICMLLSVVACGGDDDDGGGAGGETPKMRQTTCVGPAAAALEDAAVPAGFCASEWASDVSEARGIVVDESGNVLVVARGTNSIVLLYDDDGNGVSDSNERATIASAPGINHGITLHEGFLYASSDTTVYRWAYAADRAQLGDGQVVVSGLPAQGHSTRTLVFDGEDQLYVSIGSGSNLDPNSNRARIVRYPLAALESGPQTFQNGELFADGLRNEVGVRPDPEGRMWGVENGMDNLNREDLGGDIHNDNPAEELNLFEEPGRFYGYPYCWSEFRLPDGVGMGPLTQWATPTFMDDGTHTDAWCRDTANVVVPKLAMQAHSAPLDIVFYTGGSFPNDMIGDALISFHGSWNRDAATGYKVVRVDMGENGMPLGDPVPLLEYAAGGDTGDGWPYRPVGLAVGPKGQLFVTSDATNSVIVVGHDGS